MARSSSQKADGQEIEDLRKEIKDLRGDLKQIAKETRDTGSDHFGAIRQSLEQMSQRLKAQAQEKAHEVYDSAREHGEEYAVQAREGISQRPLTAVLGAFAAGYILARIRRRS